MNEKPEISVVISTYNRCDELPSAINSIIAQDKPNTFFEIIVVDNNSTDNTRQVVKTLIESAAADLRYVFEPKQGVSHARNAGIANAKAPIVAFFDDDVRVSENWIARIKDVFAAHPDIDCIGGKVLSEWQEEKPLWIDAGHWSPLALQDHGDAPFRVNADRQLCLISANLAFRKEVLKNLGGFAPELQRQIDSIGSMEDHELMTRFYKSGGQGLYEPTLVVKTEIPADRTTKLYHRRWHVGHGFFYAVMRDEDFERSAARLFDVPAHMYKQAAVNAGNWAKCLLAGNTDKAFGHEIGLRFFAGFFRKRLSDFRASGSRAAPSEIVSFIRSLLKRPRT